jgi:selenide,water dikinase
MAPGTLAQVLCHLEGKEKNTDPNLLIGFDLMDDAGVYQMSEDLALVQTVDFFTPITDDPFIFGSIAAANSLSDVYAMGGTPMTALSIACFPEDLSPEILVQILKGGEEKLKEAGVALLGGHTVNDPELKYGFSITGTIHPGKIWTNGGAQEGDVLILTKPLGTAAIATALKRGVVLERDIQPALLSMSTLNKSAMEVMKSYDIHGCTDVTGFGLLGHGIEMAKASDKQLTLYESALPLLPKTIHYIQEGYVPGGSYSNLAYFQPHVSWERLPECKKLLLADPQTSGGLLISLPKEQGSALLEELHRKQPIRGAEIGSVGKKRGGQPYLVVLD